MLRCSRHCGYIFGDSCSSAKQHRISSKIAPMKILATFSSFVFLLLLLLLLLLPRVQKTASGWENTMAVKDGEAPKLHPANA